MWKITNGYAPKVLSDFFVSNEQNNTKFVLPHPPNEKAKNYFVYSCVLAWNTVPDVLKNVTIFSAFTRNLKGYLLGDPIENNIYINENARVNNNNTNTNIINLNNNYNGIRVLRWNRNNRNRGVLTHDWDGSGLTNSWDN